MASPSDASFPVRRSSTTNITTSRQDDVDLTESLQQLSISHATDSTAQGPKSPLLDTSSTPWKSSSRHSSPSRNARKPSRSPSSGREPREGGSGLLRKASMNSLHSANGVGPGKPPSRRSSYAQANSPTSKSSPGLPPIPPEPKPPATAASVARECLESELRTLHAAESTASTKTIVILNDAVYGHRFSRPRTSRNALSTIVERPERIRAGVLGISLAYVRLGERHSEGALPLHPKRDPLEIQSLPFRIHKTTRRLPLLSPAVTNVHGTKWMEELKIMCDSAEAKLASGGKELQRPDRPRGPDYAAPQKLHEGDLYLCSESLNAIEGALGAVCEAVDTVFGPGPRRAFVGVRPPGHHCSASHPSGFCWVNNVHVGIMHGFLTHGLTHAAIIDFDLHHGDGSQAITWQHNSRSILAAKNTAAWKKTSIGYFSLHDINSYPCEGGDEEKVKNASLCIDNAHGQTVWNVHLQSWKTEQDFWELYEAKYSVILEKTRNYLKNQAERLRCAGQTPKATIFFSAGFDASEWESAGMQRHQVNVPTEFYARLSQDVIKLAAEEGLGVDGRVISVLEGGYSDRAIASGTFSHLSGLVSDQKPLVTPQTFTGLGSEMSQKIGAVWEEPAPEPDQSLASTHRYDPQWWSISELDRLDAVVAGPVAVPQKPRQPSVSTYSSPTQASTAKVSDPVKMRRSLSGLNQANKAAAIRPVSPPPPEVPWTIAAHELSKLLIPSDRQTESCKPEDLNAEATRQRQARQTSLAGSGSVSVPSTPDRASSRMALRGRKPKPTLPIGEEELSKNRRQTVGTGVSPEKARNGPSSTNISKTARRTSRRLSGASAVITPTEEMPPPPQVGADSIPGSSQGAGRPDMTGRSQSASNLAVKKTRAPTAARKQPPSTPRTPRTTKKITVPPHSAKAAIPSTQPAPAASTSGRASADEIEKITSGVKKIKINLITKSQKEARERGQESSSSRTTPAPESLKAESRSSTPLISPTSEVPCLAPSRSTASPSELASETDAGSLVATMTSAGPSTPNVATFERGPSPLSATSPTIPQLAIEPSSDAGDMFIPYQPEGPPPEASEQSEPLTWLPPSVSTQPPATPSPVKKQDNLYHHKPGSIPFAPRQQNPVPRVEQTLSTPEEGHENKEVKPETSVDDTPKPPQA